MNIQDYVAVYIASIPESQNRQEKILLSTIKYDNLGEYIMNNEIYSKYQGLKLNQLYHSLDITLLQVYLLQYISEKDYPKLYVISTLLITCYLQLLDLKKLQVDDFLKIFLVKHQKKISLIEILLKIVICIPSTTYRRIIFSKFQQIVFLYSSYYQKDIFKIIDQKIIKTFVLDFIDGVRNVKDQNDIVEQINIFTVFLSNSPQQLADFYIYEIELHLENQYKDKSIFNFLIRQLQKAPTFLQSFIKEAVVFSSLLIFNRKLKASVTTYQINESFFTQLDDINLINRHQEYLVFIPHSLLYHYSFKTYLFSQVQHLQIDLMTSITIDIQNLQQLIQVDIQNNKFTTSHIQQNEQYLAFYIIQDKKFTFLKIINVTYQSQQFITSQTLQNGKYQIFQVHGSINNHIQTLQLLKEILIAEIYDNSVTDLIKSNQHTPGLTILQIQNEDVYRTMIKQVPYLSFTKNTESNLQEIQSIIIQSIQHLNPTLNLLSQEIFANKYSFTYDAVLSSMLTPLKPAQMACLIHIITSDILYIIGAPGTGKTYTTAQIIRAFLLFFPSHWKVPKDWKTQREFVFLKKQFNKLSFHSEFIGFLHANPPKHQIILTAHSNNATDQMAEALIKDNFPLTNPFIFRLGSQSNSNIIGQYTVDGYIQLFYKDLVLNNLADIRKQANLQNLRLAMEQHYDKFSNIFYHFKSHFSLQQALLSKADVIIGTTTGIQQQSPFLAKQSILIIEEAARITEYTIASLIPLAPAKLIQIGDVLQLPPVVKDIQLSTNCGLQESLFHKQIQLKDQSILLNCQMRTTTQICDLYRDIYKLKLPPKLQKSLTDNIQDTKSSLFGYQIRGTSENETNKDEINKLAQIHSLLLQTYNISQITILSLYKKQTTQIYNSLNVKAFTVDEFQGLENDVVIISLCNPQPSKFALDLNRTLVAFSRARKEIHVIGNIKEYDNLIYQKFKEIADIQ